jgi:hypothetical protein
MSPLLGFGILVALLFAWLIHKAATPPRWRG